MEEDKYTKVPTTNNRLLRTQAYVLVGGADSDRTYPSAGKAATYDGTPRMAVGPIGKRKPTEKDLADTAAFVASEKKARNTERTRQASLAKKYGADYDREPYVRFTAEQIAKQDKDTKERARERKREEDAKQKEERDRQKEVRARGYLPQQKYNLLAEIIRNRDS